MENKENHKDVKDGSSCLKALEGLLLQKIDGVNHFKFDLNNNLEFLHNLMLGLNIRPDDILSTGFPRSGNHWMFEVTSMVLNQTTNFEKDQLYSRLLEYLGCRIQATIDKIQSPRILATHLYSKNIPVQAVQLKIKLIYIIRNPKDVLASLYKFVLSLAHEGSTFRGTWDDFFELQMIGEFPFGSWCDHVLAFEAFMRENPECPVFVLVYEKLKENPVQEISKLCKFLGKPTTLAGQIAEVTSFTRMKSELGKTKMNIQTSNHFRNGPSDIMRKGQIGDWKNFFTIAQSEAFDKLFEEKMANSKLGDLVREYI